MQILMWLVDELVTNVYKSYIYQQSSYRIRISLSWPASSTYVTLSMVSSAVTEPHYSTD